MIKKPSNNRFEINERKFILRESSILAEMIAPLIKKSVHLKQESKRDCKFHLLLGSGCSINSDILSAEGLIWQWKEKAFSRQFPKLDPSSKLFKAKFKKWLDDDLPEDQESFIQWFERVKVYGSVDREYGTLFQYIRPSSQGRRDYIEQLVSDKIPR